MKHLDLFSGIGGFALAASWLGIETVAFCEIEEFPCKVLKKNFPHIPIHGDINDLGFMVDTYANLSHILDMGKLSEKYKGSVEMYESGLSVQDCAEFYNISRQAMHTILKRRGCNFRDNKKYGKDNHFYRGNEQTWDEKRCQQIVEKAIKKGILSPQPCEVCGEMPIATDGRSLIHAHHDNYNFPLEVRWLCQKHHHEWHKNNKPVRKEDTPKVATVSGKIDLLTGGYP